MNVPIEVRKTQFDLAQFDDVTLVKQGTFEPVSVENATTEALQRLGGDSAKLAEVLNAGLKSMAMQTLRESADGWHTFELDSEGEPTDKVNGPFAGQLADIKVVNGLVLSLSKSVFGFNKDMSKDQKRAAKEQAKEFIKSNPAIREGLAKTAVATEAE